MTSVLLVGAGPTGLTLALELARRAVPARIIDRQAEDPAGSRGKGLSPRSLEVLDDLGVVDQVNACGVTHLPHRKYRGAEVVAEVDPAADQVATPDVPYPTGVLIPQWRIEQLLRGRLADFGVTVERGQELRRLIRHGDGVTAEVGDATIEATYLVGCDGGRSTVRKALGLPLNGHTPDTQQMAVGDVEVDGLSRDAWHQWFTVDGAIMLCPLPGTDSFQVQASPERAPDGSPRPPRLARFQETFDRVATVDGVRMHDLTWQSTYQVQVRMVDRLRVDRVFLAGDAAHVHPIAGGLGLNTGIQDAYNLGWKLAAVLAGTASPALLDSYDEERLPIASWLLDITSHALDVVLKAVESAGGGVDAAAMTELTQLGIGYRWSRLSRETVARADGLVRAGDRAPDAPLIDPATGAAVRLFDVFRRPDFTLLAIGADPGLDPGPVHVQVIGAGGLLDDSGTVARTYGEKVLVLVRPDGYVGLIAAGNDLAAVRRYLNDL